MTVQPDMYNPPAMANRTLTYLTIIGLVVATIMVLALTVSIALVFTIGKPDKNDNQVTSVKLPDPCECGCPVISLQLSTRIVNGEVAVPNSWPWQLLLVNFGSQGQPAPYCGASLITPRHVLTAAHCVFGWSPRNIGVIPRLHVFNASSWSPTLAHMAERIYVHESYDDDVPLIRLREPITLDDHVSLACIAPADMKGQELKKHEPLVATGWGALESVNHSRPSVLQQVRLRFVPQTDPLCSALVGLGQSARPGQICAGFPPQAICFGDSGGPLVRSIQHSNRRTYWQQVGIMLGTVNCGYASNFPDVYAHVSYYNPWILDKIRISS